MARLSRRECNDLISKLSDEHIDHSEGKFDVIEAGDLVADRVSERISGTDELRDLVHSLIAGKVREHVRRRTIEISDEEGAAGQMEFPDYLANNILMIDSRTAIRLEFATLPMIEAAHERRNNNVQKQIAAFERWEERIQKLREAGMADNPQMTFGEALIVINGRRSAGASRAAEARVAA